MDSWPIPSGGDGLFFSFWHNQKHSVIESVPRSFLGQVPIVLLCLFLTGWQLRSKSADTIKLRSHPDDRSTIFSRLRDWDVLGIVLLATVMTNFLLVLNVGGQETA